MRKTKKLVVLLLVCSITLSGCWDKKVYEEIGFILSIGIETSEKEHLLVSFAYPIIGAISKDKVEVSTTSAGILREGRENLRRVSPRSLEAGKVQQCLFSIELAQKGIQGLTEVLQRDPANPSLAWVVVVDGSPKELLEKTINFEDKPRVSIYLNQLLEGNMTLSYIPETRVYDFDIIYFAPGIDPIAPLIKLTPENIAAVGSALFSGEKMVGRIDHKETSLLLAMMGMMKRTEYTTVIPGPSDKLESERSHIALFMKNCKREIDVKIEDNKPVVDISLTFTANLDEYKWGDLVSIPNQKEVEKYIAEDIKKECEKITKYIKDIGSDPIGIGDIIRAKHNSYWKSVDWNDAYKETDINIDVKVEIMQFGTIT